MITACSALSIRRRGSSSEGKNEPDRSLGILTAMSPDVVDCQRPGAMPVAVRLALIGALVAAGADLGGGLGLDQRLHAGADGRGSSRGVSFA